MNDRNVIRITLTYLQTSASCDDLLGRSWLKNEHIQRQLHSINENDLLRAQH